MGHLIEMAEGSGLGAVVNYSKVPVIPALQEYLKNRVVPDATFRNWNAYQSKVAFGTGVNVMEAFTILPDPQTNGGLLMAVSQESLPEVQALLQQEGLGAFVEPIGKITTAGEKCIQVLA